jgi:glycosyl transferase family 25
MSIDRLFSRTVCINLDRRPDRWARMRDRFARLGMLTVERFSAVDGKDLDAPPQWSGMEGAYGCLRSHMSVIAAAAADGCESVLVLEDDVEFADDLGPKVDRALRELPQDWSFLYLGGFHRRPLIPLGETVGLATHTLSTFAYAVRRPSFGMFLAFDPSLAEAIDIRLARSQGDRPFHCLRRNLGWLECDYSDIQGSVSNHWYIRESLVIGDTCHGDFAGRAVLVVPTRLPAWDGVDPAVISLLTEHFRQAIPGLEVVIDENAVRSSCAYECAGRIAAGCDEPIEYILVAGSPVLFSRSHLIGAMEMCRSSPVVSPFAQVVRLSGADIRRVLTGRRKEIDLSIYLREPCDGLDVGWGFFRRSDLNGIGASRADSRVYQVPSFGLYLRPEEDRDLSPGPRDFTPVPAPECSGFGTQPCERRLR